MRASPRCAATTTTAETISTTSGRAIPGVEVRVVDDDGAEVPSGEPGEVVVRGYNVMQGYFEDPEQTAEAIDADGWLHTGDIGTMDDRGYLAITDRKKDMFIIGRVQRLPGRDRERCCSRHPQIAQVAVIGVPDERMGEVGMAFVVPAAGTDARPRRGRSPGRGSTWRTSRCRATSRSSTRCR